MDGWRSGHNAIVWAVIISVMLRMMLDEEYAADVRIVLAELRRQREQPVTVIIEDANRRAGLLP